MTPPTLSSSAVGTSSSANSANTDSSVDTEPIDVPGRSRVDTLEIPVTPPQASQAPPAPPQAQLSPPQLASPQPEPAVRVVRRRGAGAPALAAVAFLAAGAGVLAGALGLGAVDLDRLASLAVPGQSGSQPEAAPGEALEPASVTSVDPSGGSGFQATDSGGWRTQTYTTAEFGNLKDGVGLLVDLGEAQEVGAVSLNSATPGLSVELRPASSPSDDPAALEVVDEATTSGATTELSAADADAARYWLVWVTELAPGGDGFSAEIEDVEVRAEG